MNTEDRKPKLYVRRAELVLAREDLWPLREVPLDPDPLNPFAEAFGRLRDDQGDEASVVVDLLPVTRGAVARRRKRVVGRLERGSDGQRSGGQSVMAQLLDPMGSGKGGGGQVARHRRREGVARLDELDRERTLAQGLRDTDTHFQAQVLIRAASWNRARARALLETFTGCFEMWAHENYWRPRGRRLGGRYLAVDAPWNRALFDFRVDRQVFRPGNRHQMVAAGQIAGLLKPPTVRCSATNVIRTGGVVPPAPRSLPTFRTGDTDLLPWGVVRDDDRERVVGVNLDETFFTWQVGRSRYGKTESALVRFLHLAMCGHGCMFLDPHADALERIKPYLVDVADRVMELSIARGSGGGQQVGWNPFAMAGQDGDVIEDKLSAIVDSIATAMGWDSSRAPRALTVTQMTALSLLHLSRQLPAHLAPTIFQMTTMLTDETWRQAAITRLPRDLQQFWTNVFPRYSEEAITPLTNLIYRLRGSDSVAALLGSPESSYDLRRAMDDGMIMLVRLAGTSQIDKLVASFVVFDLLRAVRSRWDMPPDDRRPLHAFLDEVQTYDGSVKGMLAQALEEGAKYGLRLHLMNQQPSRLSPETLNAVLTNRSHLMSTQVNYDSARLLSREGRGVVTPETIQGLDKYEFITQVTHRGKQTTQFRAWGLSLDAMYGQGADADRLDDLDEAIATNSGRRPISETLARMAGHDQAILDHLTRVRPIDGLRSERPANEEGSGGAYRSDRVRRRWQPSGSAADDPTKG